MQTQQLPDKKTRLGTLVLSIVLFVALFIITHPFFKYYIDPDDASYLTIAKRYAVGDYARAINGLWSPFSPWLVSLCIRQGMDMLLAAHCVNALASLCIIVAAFFLLRRFSINRFITTALMLALPVALVHNLYWQMFDDTWQVFFLLCYLLLVTSRGFLSTWWKWLLCGAIAALAYFAKTYSFYFIILHLSVTVWILSKQEGKSFASNIKLLATVFITMLLIMSPWLYQLHQKYGRWFGYVGPINASWALTGHKTFKPGITHLIPPPYSNSPWNMEDPYLNEGHIYSVFDHPRFVVVQAARSGYAAMQGLSTMNEISFLLFTVLMATAIVIFSKKDQTLFNYQHRILLWAALIMPIGYLSMHIDSRFIWLLGYIAMIFGGVWLMKLKNNLPLRAYYLLVFVFALSYISYPIYDSRDLFHKGKDKYEEAAAIKKLSIHGSYTSNADPNWQGVTAVLTDMQYYTIEHFELSQKDLLAEMRRYHVNYYFFYCKQPDAPSIQMNDENGKPFEEVTHNGIPGLKIFLINR